MRVRNFGGVGHVKATCRRGGWSWRYYFEIHCAASLEQGNEF